MSLENLRKKLKATPVSILESNDSDVEKMVGKGGNRSKTSDYHKIESGKNLFRIFPPHEQIDSITGKPNSFAEPRVLTYLPAIVPVRDDQGKEVMENGKPKMKEGMKAIFNSKVHGKLDSLGNPTTIDLVEEYIKMAVEKAKDLYPDDEERRKEFCTPIFGRFSNDANKRIPSIIPQIQWVCYANKIEGDKVTFGRLEIKKSVKNRLNKIAALEASEDPLGTDPFTDLDEGRAIAIVYDKNAEKPEDYYTTELDSATTDEILPGGRKVKAQRIFRISDEELDAFSKVDSLEKIYRRVFSHRDLDLQIAGLQMLDSKNKLNIFDTDAFQSLIKQQLEEYPPVDETNESEEETTINTVKTTDTKASNDLPFDVKETKDDLDDMSREELVAIIHDNSLPIVVKPAALMSDEILRERIRGHYESLEVSNHKKDVEEFENKLDNNLYSQKQKVSDSNEETKTTPMSAKDRLKMLQEKQKE